MPPVKVKPAQTARSRVLHADDLYRLERDVVFAEAEAEAAETPEEAERLNELAASKRVILEAHT
jgi:hypothetical protein